LGLITAVVDTGFLAFYNIAIDCNINIFIDICPVYHYNHSG